MSWRALVIATLSSAYGVATRLGALDSPQARRLFIHAYFLYKRAVEDPFRALVQRFPQLLRDGHVLDVGANVGYTASVFARGVSPGFKVFAFEPERDNFALLTETMARLGLSTVVEPVRAAVGTSGGAIELWRNQRHPGDHRIATDAFQAGRGALQTETVRLVSIDEFARERGIADAVRFLKIDVQGYEPAVLEGMTETLRRNPRVSVAVEYMPRAMRELGFDPDAFIRRLHRLELQPLVITHQGGLERFAAREIDSRGYADLLCTREPSLA